MVNLLDFGVSVGISVISLILSTWAIRATLKGNKLLMSLTQSIQLLATKSKKGSREPDQLKKRRIEIDEQKEQRKRLETDLKRQQHDWKKKKDVAKAIKWILESLESEDE